MSDEYTTPSQFLILLDSTAFPCARIERIGEGNANFSFRGHLSEPTPSGLKTVFIKHAEPYVAKFRAFKFGPERSNFEYTVLEHLTTLDISTDRNTVSTPRPLQFLPDSHTAIYEDVQQSETLKTALLADRLSRETAVHVGAALGAYIARLHVWGRDAEQEALRRHLASYDEATRVIFSMTYGSFHGLITAFPGLLAGNEDLFARAKQWAQDVFFGEDGGRRTVTHGDFWTGNILVPSSLSQTVAEPRSQNLHVVDWEACRLSAPGLDIGQMVAEMYLPFHFHANPVSLALIDAFLDAYARAGDVPVEEVLTAVKHFGMHLLVFPARTGWPKEGVEECVRLGLEYLEHGVGGDVEWVKGSVFKRLVRM
ncbi:kinase-like domain-containing protein [Fimicolochytrium jonesii]|uniref:kinase-like domain-containing protein n=1 Tax=Fimicolochytrium jonesii TaxID=1396493 RepID=UPI0022FF35E9|nr:kinase-like domain-containing protein [Fimicolochytrium jonesii]KAI8823350.1 kinase-like domain-containing protein [Fimicolochytrium jonesii]